MFKRLGKVLLIVAMLAATGTHWVILQSVAWTSMLARSLQTTSLERAINLTFDGKHPCSLCKAIAAGKQAQRKCEFLASFKKLEFISPGSTVTFQRPHAFTLLPELLVVWDTVGQEPPIPPPRAV